MRSKFGSTLLTLRGVYWSPLGPQQFQAYLSAVVAGVALLNDLGG